jgi:hypothetical protein
MGAYSSHGRTYGSQIVRIDDAWNYEQVLGPKQHLDIQEKNTVKIDALIF